MNESFGGVINQIKELVDDYVELEGWEASRLRLQRLHSDGSCSCLTVKVAKVVTTVMCHTKAGQAVIIWGKTIKV